MALTLHDASVGDRSRAGSRTGSRARNDDGSRRRRPLLHVVGRTAAMELDRRLFALSGRAARCRLVEGRLATPLLARRGWTALGFVRLADCSRERPGIGARAVEESVRVATALESLPRAAAGARMAGVTTEELQMRAHGAHPEEAAAPSAPPPAEQLQMRAHGAAAQQAAAAANPWEMPLFRTVGDRDVGPEPEAPRTPAAPEA